MFMHAQGYVRYIFQCPVKIFINHGPQSVFCIFHKDLSLAAKLLGSSYQLHFLEIDNCLEAEMDIY